MKLKEAYSILELDSGASQDEAKKKYRELTKKYHPDINKEPGSEDKFKKINEAYQVVQTGKSTDPEDRAPPSRNPFSNFQRQYYSQVINQPENVNINTTLSFKESVIGCKKDIAYTRLSKCQLCDGNGETRRNNGCQKCGGKGQTVVRQGPSVMVSTCTECFGRTEIDPCTTCNGSGEIHTDVSIHVSVPAGISNGAVLRLQGMGNYAGSIFGMVEQYTDALCHVTVTPEPGLSIEGKDVVSKVRLSLLEALEGCTKSVKTIHGDKVVIVNPKSKNREEVIIPNYGVSGAGNQRVILDVQYPDDIGKLINVLRS